MKLPAAALLILAAVFLRADSLAQPEPRLVNLNVIAFDGHGRMVTDLTADDFQIADGGKPQKIAFFHPTRRKLRDQPALAANEFSNRTADTSRGATVILYDLLNMGFGARGYAANEMIRDLPQVESAGSLYMYLVSVDGALYPIRDVWPLPEPGSPPWTGQIKQMLDATLKSATKVRSVEIDVFIRIQLTFNMLEALGARLASIPGRKNIIWVTDGIPIELGEVRSDIGEPVDFTPQIRRLCEALDRSDIALYPVRQIMMGRSDNIGAMSDGAGATGGGGTGQSSIATLDLFADLTGGRRTAGKDIRAAIEQSMRDLEFSYQIGYYPPAGSLDNKFHKVRVTSKRKELRIQAKSGYYAWNFPPGTVSTDAFRATAGATLDAAEIGLRATVAGPAVTLRINANDLALSREGDAFTGHLRILAVGYSPEGTVTSGEPIPADFRLTVAQRDEALRNGIVVAAKLPPVKDEGRFRIIVFDRGSNAVGSITVPVEALRAAR